MTTMIDLVQDPAGTFHYIPYTPSTPGGRKHALTYCGFPRTGMRVAAFFRPTDPRGGVHYVRGCGQCRDRLVI
jgi:hypothetical protein